MLNLGLEADYGLDHGLSEQVSSGWGMTPASYQRGGKGAQICFSVVPCSLGFLLVGATSQGICSVTIGSSAATLESGLRQEFPMAQIQPDPVRLSNWTASLLGFLAGHTSPLDLPVDVPATAFQWRVWQVLRSISYGETRSYSQVATLIGQPQAVRAVARACATNPVALVVPCHRVVRSDGSLGGFRWGLERKEELLRQEQEYSLLLKV